MKNKKIIFVEGLWKSGKSTAIQLLVEKYQLKNIDEPSHLSDLTLTTPQQISTWYLNEHYKNIDRAIDVLHRDDAVIIERSPVSSLAFINTYQNELFDNKKLLGEFKKKLSLLKNKGTQLIFIYLTQDNLEQTVERMKSDPNTKQYAVDFKKIKTFDKKLRNILLVIHQENLAKVLSPLDSQNIEI